MQKYYVLKLTNLLTTLFKIKKIKENNLFTEGADNL